MNLLLQQVQLHTLENTMKENMMMTTTTMMIYWTNSNYHPRSYLPWPTRRREARSIIIININNNNNVVHLSHSQHREYPLTTQDEKRWMHWKALIGWWIIQHLGHQWILYVTRHIMTLLWQVHCIVGHGISFFEHSQWLSGTMKATSRRLSSNMINIICHHQRFIIMKRRIGQGQLQPFSIIDPPWSIFRLHPIPSNRITTHSSSSSNMHQLSRFPKRSLVTFFSTTPQPILFFPCSP